MALGKKYTFDFIDSAIGTLLKYEIWAEGYTGDPIVLTVAGDDTIIITTEGRDTRIISSGIKGSSATLQLSTRSGLRMRDFLTENPRQFQLRAFKNTYMQFIGWAQPILSDEPLRPAPYSFELTFSDALADLTKVNLKKNDAIPSQPLEGIELLALCLKQTGYDLPIVIVDNLYQNQLVEIGDTPTQSSWEGWQWETLRFFDGAEPWNVYRILENLCKRRTATLMQADGRWWFIRLPDYRTNPVKAWQYDANGANPTSFDWTHTVDIPYNVTATQASALLVMKGLESNAKSWNPSLKKVIHRIQYGHFRNQLLGQLFDGSLNYEYIITTIGGEVVAADAGGALNLKNFKFKTPKEGATVGLPAGIPYARTNYFQFQFRTKDTVKTNMVSENNYVRFLEKKIGKTELVRFTTRLQNVDFKGGRVCIVAYSIANLPDMLEDLGDTQQIIKAFTERRFLDASGAWVIEPTVIDIENTEKKEIDDETVDVSSDEPRTFTVTSTTPYPVNNQDAYIRIYLLSGELLENTEADEENRYTLYDEISLETSQYFKDKKITAHEVKIENLANEYGETLEEEIEIGETLNDLNYAYPLGISNTPSGLASAVLRNTGWWYEYGIAAPEPPINYFRSQNEWAAYSMLRMRQALQMVITGILRGFDYGPHHRFRIVGGGDDFDGKTFLVLSRQRDEWRSTSNIILSEWIYAPVTVKVSRKATTGTEGTPLGSGSTFENWYSSSRGGANPDTRGGRIGVPEDGGGGGLPDSVPPGSSLGDLSDLEADAYKDRGIVTAPIDFRILNKNGDWEINLETWEGCDFAPSELASQGKLQAFVGGGTKKLIYTDANGFVAEWAEVDGQEVTEDMWVYMPTQDFTEFDEQGRQLVSVGRIEKGKIVEMTQKTIYKGVESMGLFGGTSVLQAIPVLSEGQTLHAIDGIYNWQISDWNAITDKPNNLSGPGFLNVTFFGGFVHLNAFAYADLSSAFAIRQNLSATLSPWQLSTVGEYYNKTTIDYLLGFYSQIGHNHDDRYYLISEVNQLLENYRLNTWLPNIEDVSGLSISLANKIDISLFLNGIIGGALIVGEDKQPTIIDLDDPYIDAAILVNAKVGQTYGQSVAASGIFDAYTGYKIDETQIVWPRGALNKRVIPVSAQSWIGFEFHQSNGSIGSSYDGQGFIIKGNSTPTVSGEASILVDMIHTTTPNGRPRREQRVLLIRVDPADAVITTPSTPTPAVATAVSTTQINVSWADVAGEAGYEIWSSNAPAGYYTRIGSTGPNQTSFQHLNLEPNTAYYYKINAYNSAGSSGFADANATTLAGSAPVTGGLYARYYPSTTLDTTTSVNRVDQVIDFNLVNTDPIAGIPYGAFSVRWSGKIKSPVSGNIGFQFNSNAGIRIWVGGQPVVDNWVDRTVLQANQFSVSMVANTDYDIIIEYYQINNTTRAHLQYRNGTTYEVVPTTWLTPVALLGAPIPAPVLTASPEGSDTVNLAWTYSGSADYFEVSGGTSNTVFPVLNNHVPLGAAREEIIGGLPSSTTFYFRIRAYTGGRYSPYSNIATAATAAPEQLPNAPAPVSLTRIVPGDLSGSNLEVRFTDTNVGTEQYEIRFREYGTTQWFTLVAGFQLSPNAANPLLLSYNTPNIVQSISNNTFQGKRMEVAVRVVKSATLKSVWASAVEAPADSGSGGDPVDPNTEVQIIEYEDFVVVRNQDGTYSDTKPRTVGDEFHAFYLCEDDYDIDFYNADGSPKAFENITLDVDSVYVFRKLMLRKSVYPTLQSWKENAWWSNIGQQESNMLYSAQAVVRTYGTPSQEVVVGAPNPIIVTRVGTSDIDITILIAGRTQGRSYEINYRVVGTSTWYVFASDFSLKPFPATANLVQEPIDATTNIVVILEDRELFTQGRIEVRARAYENGNVSAWSSIYAEPANSDKLDLSLLLLDWGGNWGNDEIMWSDNSYHNGYWYASPASTVPTGLTVSSWPKIQGAANYASSKKLKSIVMPVFWDRCNPAEGVYIFQQIRFAVLYIASKGLKTHFFVDATRRWTADPAFRTTSDWTFNLEDAEIDEHGNLHGEPFNHIPALGSDKWNNWFIFVRALAEALADLSEHIGWYAGSSNPTKEWGTLFNENSTSHPDTIAMYQAWHNLRYGTTPSAIAKVSDTNSTNKQRTGKFHSLRMIELWESATEEIKAANPSFKTVYHMSSATDQTFKRTCLTVPANLPSVIDGMKSNPARAFDPSFAIRAVARPGKLAIVEYAYDEVEYAGVHPGVAGYEIAAKVKIAFDNGATGAVLAFFENAYANIGGPADVCLTALVESLESAGYLDTTYNYYTGNPDIINMSAVVAMANSNGDYEQAYLAQFDASKDARFQQLPAINYVDDI